MCDTTCCRRVATVQFIFPGGVGITHGEHTVHSIKDIVGADAQAIEEHALAQARALSGPDKELRVVRDYAVDLSVGDLFLSHEVKVKVVGPRVEAKVTVSGNTDVTITLVSVPGGSGNAGERDSRCFSTGPVWGRSKRAIRREGLARAHRAFGPDVKLRIARGCTYKPAADGGYYTVGMKVMIVG
ncbi:hypothetical protein [Actinomadura sp. NPDC049753]|uniref:hypothetical protein n=1 Tax=Actinomadura sp. NPDC049753 TaxID=3154739 RepID=UPI003416DA5F